MSLDAVTFLESLYDRGRSIHENPAALATCSQALTMPVESEVVGTTDASTAVVGDVGLTSVCCEAVRNEPADGNSPRPATQQSDTALHAHAREAEPRPCPSCGCPIYWLLPTGNMACGNCTSRPAAVVRKLIVVTTGDGRNEWADYEAERQLVAARNSI